MPDQPSLGDPMLWAHVGFWAISLVLIGSGAAKIVDAGAFVRFLSESSGRAVTLAVGRVIGGIEVLLGLAGLAVGGRGVAIGIAVAYGAFTVIVAVAMHRGAPSCGCFGAVSSRPRPAHLVMNVASVLLAALGVVDRVPPVADGVAGLGGGIALVIAVMLVAASGVIFVDTR